jgi:hypothetical protein
MDTFGNAHFGKISGAIQTGYAVPSIVAPILGGAVFDATGDYAGHVAITIPVFASAVRRMLEGGQRRSRWRVTCAHVPTAGRAAAARGRAAAGGGPHGARVRLH